MLKKYACIKFKKLFHLYGLCHRQMGFSKTLDPNAIDELGRNSYLYKYKIEQFPEMNLIL